MGEGERGRKGGREGGAEASLYKMFVNTDI